MAVALRKCAIVCPIHFYLHTYVRAVGCRFFAWIPVFTVYCTVSSRCKIGGDLGEFYTSPRASDVRTLNGHIDIPLAKHLRRGHVAKKSFGTVRGPESGPNVLWPRQLIMFLATLSRLIAFHIKVRVCGPSRTTATVVTGAGISPSRVGLTVRNSAPHGAQCLLHRHMTEYPNPNPNP